jgi:hypothetical protein
MTAATLNGRANFDIVEVLFDNEDPIKNKIIPIIMIKITIFDINLIN